MGFFSQLNTVLVAALGPMGPIYVLGALGIVMIAGTAPILLRRTADPLDRLTGGNQTAVAKPNTEDGRNRSEELKLRGDSGGFGLDALANYLEPQDESEYGAARLKLIQAGYRGKTAVSTFHFIRVVFALVGLALGVLGYFMGGQGGGIANTIGIVLGPGAVAYILPNYWVNRRVQERKDEITRAFPDSLDMMLVCIEAGQSLDQAILRVAKEIQNGYPVLAEEFEIVANELRAGKDRVSVLRDFSERCGVTDVSSFVTVLIQSASFGTSIASALRVYSAEMRDKRVMRAEEKANTLPTKLTLGTMMFTVPPLLIILVGPSVYAISQTLG
ncbi:MAG: type II secretion system F family protein [Rubricella sp.]